MGSCKGTGKKVKRTGRIKMKIKGPRIRSPIAPNKHRSTPAKAKGFHFKSLQMGSEIKGIHKRFDVDKHGTITNVDRKG